MNQLISKKAKVSKLFIVKAQLRAHLDIEMPNVKLSEKEFTCLAYLALYGEPVKLSEFCNLLVDEDVYQNPQSARNFLTALLGATSQLIVRDPETKKISLNIPIATEGRIVFNLTLICTDGI